MRWPRACSRFDGGGVLLAALGGAALAAGGEPWVAPAVAAASFAGLVLAVEGRGPTGPGRAGWLGLLFGSTCNALALGWVVGVLERFARFPVWAAVPVAALLWAAQALPFALASAWAAALRPSEPRWWPRWVPASIAAFALTPALFPWRPGAALLGWLPWVQMADLGGPPLLDVGWTTFGVGSAGVLWALSRGEASRMRRSLAMLALAGCLPWAYGAWRMPRVEVARAAAPRIAVGVVQPNVSIERKHDPAWAPRILETLRAQSAALARRGAHLVVWPESAYPYRWPRTARLAPRGAFSPWGRTAPRVPLLVGAVSAAGRCRRWNSVVAVGARGEVLGLVDKRSLLAFGEYVPGWRWLPPLRRLFRCPGILPGESLPLLRVGGAAVGVLNCYEDLLSAASRDLTHAGARWLVNVTNDAWFGRSIEPYLHHRVARLRAIETRRDLVRAVNTGVSGHVSATGADLVRTETWERASLVAEVALLDMRTLWVRVGDLLSPAAIAWLLALLAAQLRLRSRVRGSSERRRAIAQP